MPFTYVNRQGRVYYLHVTHTRNGRYAEQHYYFFNQRAERALEHLPAGFLVRGEVLTTGVPMLSKVTAAVDTGRVNHGPARSSSAFLPMTAAPSVDRRAVTALYLNE